ncbi:hypothetical protein B0H14DRAFT_933702 [Mycena olivaceomarginata]|nr:hypothetical protein B0H14DRAFT_933702 [Mycena olivaceomarginata]
MGAIAPCPQASSARRQKCRVTQRAPLGPRRVQCTRTPQSHRAIRRGPVRRLPWPRFQTDQSGPSPAELTRAEGNTGDAPSNSGEIIEISSDEDDAPRKNSSGNTAKLEARIQELEQVRALPGSTRFSLSYSIPPSGRGAHQERERQIEETTDSCGSAVPTYSSRAQSDVHQAADDLEDRIACEICSTKLWSPFILDCVSQFLSTDAICSTSFNMRYTGHTFCQQDLEGWFTKALEKHLETYSQYDVNAPPKKKKKCPFLHIRVRPARDKVCSRPIQNFAVKGLVPRGRGADGETSRRRRQSTAANVWSRFFPAQ